MKRFKRFITNLIDVMRRTDMTILPGQLAFFFIMSLVPALTIVLYIAQLLSISVSDISSYFNITLESNVFSFLMPSINTPELSIGMIVILIVGIYIVSNGMNSIIITANNIYGIEQSSFLERRIKAIIMVFILILLFLFILVVPIFGNFLLRLISKVTGEGIYNILNFLRTPFSWFIIFFFIKILYTIAPDKQIPSSYVNVGALFTSVGWVIATNIYTYYASNIANYNLYYSGLSNIAILMMLVYILATIFVIGMGINYKEEPYVMERTQQLEELKATKKSQSKTTNKDTK